MNTTTANNPAPAGGVDAAIDVLAVMARKFGVHLPRNVAAQMNADMEEARAAVARLIEAAQSVYDYCTASVPEDPCHADLDTIGNNLRAALARIQPEAK